MTTSRARRSGTRGKNQRAPSVRAIKMAICDHARVAVVGPPEQLIAGGVWRTKLECPSCGAWEVRETPDDARPAAVTPPAEGAWEECAVELRCDERGGRVYPLCHYDAIAHGAAGLYLAARSADFDNGLDRADRAAIVAALGRELLADGWETAPQGADPMPHFRRRAVALLAVTSGGAP